MKSGSSSQSNDSYVNSMLEDQLTLITMVTEDAIKLSEIYSKHAKRVALDGKPVIATEDFSRAFKVRAYHGAEFWNLPDTQEKIRKIKEWIQEESDSEDEMGDGSDLNTISDSQMSQYHDSECKMNNNGPCIVCKYMNEIPRMWPAWVPQTPMELILKKAIDSKFPKLPHN